MWNENLKRVHFADAVTEELESGEWEAKDIG